MVLELLLSAVYQVVKSSWMFSTVFIKYFLAGVIVREVYRGSDLPGIVDALEEFSEDSVAIILVSGVFFAAAGVEIEPFLQAFSEVVALAYFAFLFWRF